MGFYGNITNTSNTTFSFDRIYPNRLAMDANANNDGIFIGRYVLVEYDQDAAYPNVFLKDNQYYSSPNTEDLTRVRFLSGERYYYEPTTDEYPIKGKQYYIKIEDSYIPADIKTDTKFEDLETTYYEKVESVDGVYKEEIVQVQEINTDDKGHTTYINIGFYECVGFVTENSIKYATFQKITKDPTAKSNYIQNFAIDEKHQDAEQQKSFKGYDSTVWVKSSITTNDGKLITKYVNIADLNSVVPTFDIAADAPTMIPITPHFDADSTNVYYKLHIQPQWGMRVAAADGDSDVETYWTRENYNPQTGLSTKEYWDKNQANWITYTDEEEIKKFDAAIYYNKAGFEEYTRTYIDNVDLDDNIINIEPTGESGNLYSNHNQSNSKSTAKDIQEIRINLPAIGNMMSDAWDIIHGPNRDDYRGDGENSSLQGRLDAFQDICANQIAVKSSDKDGTIVGSKINNGEKYVHEGDILDKRLNVEDEGLLNNDDPWIRTYINTADLVHSTYQDDSGLSQEDNNGIAIQHTFHATADSETSLDKNNGKAQVSERQEKYIHAIKDSNGNIIKTPINAEDGNTTDKIKLYTPYVDATGHVVGKNIETITLPYGYKHFKTDGLSPKDIEGKDIVDDLYSTVNYTSTEDIKTTGDIANSSVAHNTQDTLSINPANKWIQTKIVDTENDGDVLTIAHEIHSIDERYKENSNLNNLSIDNENVSGNLTIYDWTYDNAGHITSKREHTYTLPYGYKTFTTSGLGKDEKGKEIVTDLHTKITISEDGANTSFSEADTTQTVANNTQDSMAIEPYNKWIQTQLSDDKLVIAHEIHAINTEKSSTDLNDLKDNKIQNEINIPDWDYDDAGHIKKKGEHIYTLPYGYKSFTDGTNTSAADSTQDSFTMVGDSWLQPVVDDNKITYKHIGPVSGTNLQQTSASPKFKGAFDIITWEFDERGHKNQQNKQTITLPTLIKEDSNFNSTGYSLISNLDFVDDNNQGQKLQVTRKLVGDVPITNYELMETSEKLNAQDTINQAFSKLQKQIIIEENTRKAEIEKLLNGASTEELDSIMELVNWVNEHDTVDVPALIADIKANTTLINQEITNRKDITDNLKSAAYTETTAYDASGSAATAEQNAKDYADGLASNYATANQGALADSAIQRSTTFTYGEEQKTIQELMNIVNDLQKQINELKIPPQEPDNSGEEI